MIVPLLLTHADMILFCWIAIYCRLQVSNIIYYQFCPSFSIICLNAKTNKIRFNMIRADAQKGKDLFNLSQQQIVMNQQQKPEGKVDYVWTNRGDYDKDGIQQLGDKLTIKQPDEVESSNVSNLFSKVHDKSMTTLVYFNDKTGEMSLYSLPHIKKKIILTPGSFQCNGIYGDSRSYFWKGLGIERKFGERGLDLNFAAIKMNSITNAFTFSYRKTLGERLDKHFCANADEFGLNYTILKHKYAEVLEIGLFRQSRHNFYHPYQNTEVKNEKIFGQGTLNAGRIKHSNMLLLKCNYKWNGLNVNSFAGTDFGNKSYVAGFISQIKGDFQINKAKIVWSFEVGNVWGRNVLPNDLLFRNQRRWTGNRSSNFATPRLEYHITDFPYLSLLKFNPYFYGQLWGVHSRKEGQNHVKIQAQYGLGISNESGLFKFDINLFQLSTQKFGGEIGNIKFSF